MTRQGPDPATWTDRGLARGFIHWFNRDDLDRESPYVANRDRLYIEAVMERRGDLPVEEWVHRHAR